MDTMTVPALSLVLLAAGALVIRVGMMLHASGVSRSKNAASAALRSIVEMASAALALWALGGAILLGRGGSTIGFSPRLLFLHGSESSTFIAAACFYLVLTMIAAGPISIALGERGRLGASLAAAVALAGVVAPLCGHWSWSPSGWLRAMKFVDVGGAGALHVTGGLFAAAGAALLGPRLGKYNTDRSANLIPGHNVPLAGAGVLLMMAGWLPYMIGASVLHGGSVSLAALNVLLAGSAAVVVSFGMSRVRYGKPDVLLTLGGLLGGMISISAAGGTANPLAAVAIGAIGALLVLWSTVWLDNVIRIDDPGGSVAAHVIGGLWGILAAGIFTAQATWGERMKQIGVQLLGAAVIAAFAAAVAIGLFYLLKQTIGLRISEADEYDGIDLAEHDLNAYPDFQQTMIKSYHLREA